MPSFVRSDSFLHTSIFLKPKGRVSRKSRKRGAYDVQTSPRHSPRRGGRVRGSSQRTTWHSWRDSNRRENRSSLLVLGTGDGRKTAPLHGRRSSSWTLARRGF